MRQAPAVHHLHENASPGFVYGIGHTPPAGNLFRSFDTGLARESAACHRGKYALRHDKTHGGTL